MPLREQEATWPLGLVLRLTTASRLLHWRLTDSVLRFLKWQCRTHVYKTNTCWLLGVRDFASAASFDGLNKAALIVGMSQIALTFDHLLVCVDQFAVKFCVCHDLVLESLIS